DRIVGAVGASRAVYAVGGTVRDLLLDRPLIDLDLAFEGDAIAVLRAALPAVRSTTHVRFSTATATVGGLRIDVATARRESYTRPGALPSTQPASIEDDLRRRDFSVNALAL